MRGGAGVRGRRGWGEREEGWECEGANSTSLPLMLGACPGLRFSDLGGPACGGGTDGQGGSPRCQHACMRNS